MALWNLKTLTVLKPFPSSLKIAHLMHMTSYQSFKSFSKTLLIETAMHLPFAITNVKLQATHASSLLTLSEN